MRITTELINHYQQETYHMLPGQRLTSPQHAVDFVNERGLPTFGRSKASLCPVCGALWPVIDL
jgi:hypothetical protein